MLFSAIVEHYPVRFTQLYGKSMRVVSTCCSCAHISVSRSFDFSSSCTERSCNQTLPKMKSAPIVGVYMPYMVQRFFIKWRRGFQGECVPFAVVVPALILNCVAVYILGCLLPVL